MSNLLRSRERQERKTWLQQSQIVVTGPKREGPTSRLKTHHKRIQKKGNYRTPISKKGSEARQHDSRVEYIVSQSQESQERLNHPMGRNRRKGEEAKPLYKSIRAKGVLCVDGGEILQLQVRYQWGGNRKISGGDEKTLTIQHLQWEELVESEKGVQAIPLCDLQRWKGDNSRKKKH